MKYIVLFIIFAVSISGAITGEMDSTTKPKDTKAMQVQQEELDEYDAIEVVIFTSEGESIITKSDIERPALGGGAVRSRDDLIFEQLVVLDAKKHKIMPDDDAVDKYLAAMQREHNLKQEDLDMIFVSAGLTREEGRAYLKTLQAVNTMLDINVRSNLIIPRKEMETFYNENPEYQEAAYLVCRGVVACVADKEQKQEQFKQMITAGHNIDEIKWDEPFWIEDPDLADDKRFIASLNVNQSSMPITIAEGFEFYRVNEKKERRLKTFDERYRDIGDILRRPRYEALLNNYRTTLFKEASFVYFE